MTKLEPKFWENRPLSALSKEEWEALCDGCAKCCLRRLEDIGTREIRFTNVCCRHLDQDSCHCTNYPNRSVNVPECVTVTLEILENPYWLPESCAYRLLAEGKPLYWWHPLVSGTRDSLTESANSIGGRVVSELDADDLEYHMIDWIK